MGQSLDSRVIVLGEPAHAVMEPCMVGRYGAVPEPVLSLEGAVLRASFPADATAVVIALAFLRSG